MLPTDRRVVQGKVANFTVLAYEIATVFVKLHSLNKSTSTENISFSTEVLWP
jgi:hypothetical protein